MRESLFFGEMIYPTTGCKVYKKRKKGYRKEQEWDHKPYRSLVWVKSPNGDVISVLDSKSWHADENAACAV